MDFNLTKGQFIYNAGDFVLCNGYLWIISYNESSDRYAIVDLDDGDTSESYQTIQECLDDQFHAPYQVIQNDKMMLMQKMK